MATLEITTGIGCKNDCSYCPQDVLVKAYKARSSCMQMSFDLFKQCLDKVPKKVRILFSGMAEPWLNKACTDMVCYAHQSGFAIVVYTTLVGMSLDDIDRLQPIPFKKFEVHLPDADSLTRIKTSAEYLEKLQKIVTSNISGLRFMVIGRLHPDVHAVVKEKVHVRVREVINRAGNLTDFPGIVPQERLGGMILCKKCGSNKFNNNLLLPNGDVVLCCMDYGLRYILGNLASNSYHELFQGQIFQSVQQKIIDDSQDILCRYCYKAFKSKWNYIPGGVGLRKLLNMRK